ncbi:sensor histidine kinase [Mucilaginibacter auburnensis]|uniref:Histidine kinase n=1 Tax=Mucilaginibacter auburnensis TaxID=1457233 RepID=A0A2H9VR48_9SPHI|nr:histidine kinase [Mucilaginibacter auburnensis]PJJ83258.1 histidine kinase [Mucilaginibacter auburnensis]
MKKLISWRWIQYVLPSIIWFSLLVLPFLGRDENSPIPIELHRRFVMGVITSNLALLIVFYVHTYVVYPLINKKRALYILSFVLLMGAYWIYWAYLRPNPYEGMRMRPWQTRFNDSTQRGSFGPRAQVFRYELKDSANRTNTNEYHGPMPDRSRDTNSFRQGGPRINVYRFSRGPRYMYLDLLSPLIAILLSVCYRIIIDNRAKQQLLKERETAHLKSELTFLRSQISPHFIFNVLNNLVALARKKSDALEPAIVSLSQLMRYMLYESDDAKVLLGKEVEYIKSFISLQMLRFRDTVKTNLNVEGNIDFYAIEPMLLIPFVENAFKHGTGTLETAVIDISLSVNEEKRIMHFNVTNDVGPADDSKDSNSGIGIANVRRRLAILYPNKHELTISNTPDKFTVDLTIHLAE